MIHRPIGQGQLTGTPAADASQLSICPHHTDDKKHKYYQYLQITLLKAAWLTRSTGEKIKQ